MVLFIAMLKSFLVSLILLYVFLMIYAWIAADFLMFRPHPSSYQDQKPFMKLKTKSGIEFSALYLKAEHSPVIVLFHHGNAEDLGDLVEFLTTWQKRGFSMLAYDYPGYGTSNGYPTTSTAEETAEAAYLYLVEKERIPPQQIVMYGRSLGGGLASYLATNHTVGGVIFESTFLSAFRVMTYYSILPFDKFNTLERLAQIRVPLLFIHGTKDRTIPFFHGRRLYETAISPQKQYLWVENAGHNDLVSIAKDRYFDTVQNYLQSLNTQSMP